MNPAFAPVGSTKLSLAELAPVIRSINACGLHAMADLVINHTAFDCALVQEHPEWYVRDVHGHIQHPFAVDPDNPNKKTVWKDLAEIDNQNSSDRERLWDYWAKLIDTYLEIGFEGFRCDAAYQVPVELWQFLIGRVRKVHPQMLFWAENLGCTVEQSRALRKAGFQLFCNSSKWWNFHDSWCLDQHQEFEDLRSVSFPETHDTERLSYESGGNEAIQRQRYAFAALFSTGLMMPVGFEFGFQKRLHVVQTSISDWETPQFDLQAFIQAVNQFKIQNPLFHGEGKLTKIFVSSPHLLVLERSSESDPGKRGFIVVNTHGYIEQPFSKSMLPSMNHRFSVVRLSWVDRQTEPRTFHENIILDPSEVVVLLDNERE